MWLWCASSPAPRSRRGSCRFARAGSGTCGRRSSWLAIGLFAVAFSIYVVYLLEIVKLANPRVRRRDRESDESGERMSALASHPHLSSARAPETQVTTCYKASERPHSEASDCVGGLEVERDADERLTICAPSAPLAASCVHEEAKALVAGPRGMSRRAACSRLRRYDAAIGADWSSRRTIASTRRGSSRGAEEYTGPRMPAIGWRVRHEIAPKGR